MQRSVNRSRAVALAAVLGAFSSAATRPALASGGVSPPNLPVLVDAAADLAARAERPNESWYVIAHVVAGGHRYHFLVHYLTSGDATHGVASSDVSITDETTGRYMRSELLLPARGGLSQAQGIDIHTDNVSWTGDAAQMTLQAKLPEGQLEVTLRPRGPVLYNMGTGYFPMFADASYGNYEYGLPAMETTGTLTIDGRALVLEGISWLDHQWGPLPDFTTARAGWTWLGVSLSNGSRISLWKTKYNTTTTWATVLAPDGTHVIAAATLTPSSAGTWTSPESHLTYPTHWTITIPGLATTLKVTAAASNQELLLPMPRLEGAAAVTGTSEGRPVIGSSYVEVAGPQ